MPYVSDIKPDGRFLGLFCGPSGSGKTGAACSFPEPHDWDFDGRIRGILGCDWLKGKKISYKYYPPKVGGNESAQTVWERYNNDLAIVLANGTRGQYDFKTGVLDSLSSLTLAFVLDALPITHAARQLDNGREGKAGGRFIGKMPMAGPDDYNFESTGCASTLAFLRSLPIQNIIVTAHLIDKYEKTDPDNPYSPSIVKGQKLSLRDKISAVVPTYFDHVFEFSREMHNDGPHFICVTRSDFARTTFSKLPTRIDFTGKNFYELIMKYALPEEIEAGGKDGAIQGTLNA